ncbi:MAG: hypothetical protein AAGM38_01150 [Pseudomonadota bacterium]
MERDEEKACDEALFAAAAAAGFTALTKGERRMLRGWRRGVAAQLGDATLPAAPGEGCLVRAGLIAWAVLRSNDPAAHPANRMHVIGAYIEGPIDLAGQRIRANLVLQRCRFTGPLIVSDAMTAGLDLNGSHIARDGYRGTSIDARHLRANGDVRLRDLICDGGVAMSGAEIRGDLDLSGSRFGKRRANFHGYEFEVSIGAPGAKIFGALNMLRPPKEGEMFAGALNLHNAEVNVLQDDPACWPKAGDLFLDGLRYRQIGSIKPGAADARERGRWLLLQPAHQLKAEFKPQPFEQLARVLKTTGHALEARRIGVLKQRMLRRAGRIPWYIRPFHWLFGLIAGYGYWTSRVLLWAALVVALGAGLYEAAWRAGVMTPAKPEALLSAQWGACVETAPDLTAACFLSAPPGEDYEPFNAALYSLDLFLPVVVLEQEENWSPTPHRGAEILGAPIGGWAWGYRFFHELLGYILSGFAIVGFAKLAERD